MTEQTVQEAIQKISEEWFLTEPLLLSVFCTHKLVQNDLLHVPLRTGEGRIEFSSLIVCSLGNGELEQYLRVEVLRILLKHPYQRKPPCAVPCILSFASNYTIRDCYSCQVPLAGDGMWQFERGLCFEEYYARILQAMKDGSGNGRGTGDSSDSKAGGESDGRVDGDGKQSEGVSGGTDSRTGGKSAGESGGDSNNSWHDGQTDIQAQEISGLWEENLDFEVKINELIEDAESWGSITGDMKEKILASMRIDVDYRRMLCFYRTSVLSSKRLLTRMRPSRRYGFSAMGSRYELKTNILVAVDVSGSISDNELSKFYSIINRFFKYGIERLDVLQFDCEIKGEPVPLRKARREVIVTGRGGTDFEPVVLYYAAHSEYDGLIIFTDGEAPIPPLDKARTEILWVLDSYASYRKFLPGLEQAGKAGRNRVTYIPMAK